MKVAAVLTDLLVYSRIESAARNAGAELVRIDDPAELPAVVDVVLVDWAARGPGWADTLLARSTRIILFGPHTDLEAHAAARAAGLGPMWARSKLMLELESLIAPA